MSVPNAVLVTVVVAGAVALGVLGRWFEAWLLAAVSVAAVGSALHARRPGSRDITRVNAIEYRDERDRSIARAGFSVVGAVALVLSVVEFVVIAVVVAARDWPPAVQLVPIGQLLLLCVVWAAANSYAARRS
ncbi:hypothetical protein DQ241_19820 [Blastococcus sp. TF02A-30]|nr:hypothetical protein DQ241_19820 [Blastococcus sp. TF02A-30]